jgi:hypothetical protein
VEWATGQSVPLPQHTAPLVVGAVQQFWPHTRKPLGQVLVQLPETQTVPAPQVFPHSPQFEGSVKRFTQVVGVAGAAGHCVGAVVGQTHVPLEQAPFTRHLLSQAPQLAGSVFTSTQAVGVPVGQAVSRGAAHWQAPATQASFLSGHLLRMGLQPPQ